MAVAKGRTGRAGGPEIRTAGSDSGVYCPGCGKPLADTTLIVHPGCPQDPRSWVSVPPPS